MTNAERGLLRFRTVALMACGVVLAGWGAASVWADGVRKALLIGCTEFPELKTLYGEQGYAGVRLAGPANDVALLSAVLKEQWGFESGNIAALVGWDEAAEQTRPTRANIRAAFEKLAQEANAGDLVVVYLGSHCPQLPVPPAGAPADAEQDKARAAAPASTRTAERDGFDEVFMPADAGAMDWENRKLANGIFDHEFATWLQAIRDRGAFAFVIVNTPHAAGLLDLAPEMLLKRPSRDDTPKGQGRVAGLATIYACYADESEARMDDQLGPAEQRKPQSLLSWTLCGELRKADARERSYRELVAAVLEAYPRNDRRTPTPAGEGELDKKVMTGPGNP